MFISFTAKTPTFFAQRWDNHQGLEYYFPIQVMTDVEEHPGAAKIVSKILLLLWVLAESSTSRI